MKEKEVNKETLRTIGSSIGLIALETQDMDNDVCELPLCAPPPPPPPPPPPFLFYIIPYTLYLSHLQDIEKQAKFLFHGDLHNRWFDKCITLSVASSAVVGANVEHSALDATVSWCGNCDYIITMTSDPQVAGQMWEYVMTDEEYDERGRVIEPFRNQRAFPVAPPTQ